MIQEAVPLSLYIHFPWCVRKCPYCDFNSHELRDAIPEAAYIDALLADLAEELPLVWGRRISTIFMGGGTPSLFSAESLERLMSGIRALIPVLPQAEITLEANPGTAEATRFAGYRELGINRLSLGIQSFDTALLQKIGRIHDGEEALRAVEFARQAGFDNFNLDLMFALPGQTEAGSEVDLKQAIALAPTHISRYQLTLEPNTAFYHSPPSLPGHDTAAELELAGHALLARSGYQRYEVSAFAKAGCFAQHNLNYWKFGDYIGIGAGAHGKLTDLSTQQIIRRRKQRQPARYLESGQPFLSSQNTLEPEALAFEFMLNALRLTGGFDQDLFTNRTGLPWSQIAPKVEQLVAEGLLDNTGIRIIPTGLGMRFLNDVIERFL